jgi:hypothetical protein
VATYTGKDLGAVRAKGLAKVRHEVGKQAMKPGRMLVGGRLWFPWQDAYAVSVWNGLCAHPQLYTSTIRPVGNAL